jgi:hypothetical protein
MLFEKIRTKIRQKINSRASFVGVVFLGYPMGGNRVYLNGEVKVLPNTYYDFMYNRLAFNLYYIFDLVDATKLIIRNIAIHDPSEALMDLMRKSPPDVVMETFKTMGVLGVNGTEGRTFKIAKDNFPIGAFQNYTIMPFETVPMEEASLQKVQSIEELPKLLNKVYRDIPMTGITFSELMYKFPDLSTRGITAILLELYHRKYIYLDWRANTHIATKKFF